MKQCPCGAPAETSLKYRFKAPTGYATSVDISACSSCGPAALREAAKEINAWADVMEKANAPEDEGDG